MKQMFRILLSGLGALLIFFAGAYMGLGTISNEIWWTGFIPFTVGYTSIVIARESKETTF